MATYWTVPKGAVGGSIWSSAAVTRGNSDTAGGDPGDSFSIVRLAGQTLQRRGLWTVPNLDGTDSDFGGSPTLFSADLGDGKQTPLVGACNKDGNYYVLRSRHP
ncbi:MAG: hypothetical protein E6G44_12140 [Actinobacteria bacterium]|nr:MAG: hypothetical protein E6G44_12140 [Actinomycetota bacterium]